ncbi:hypothetical protein [Nocardioides jejuensis]|uniref:Extradiol ring-cleavage dioxygenase class III enzyme subunit B domain-containing protein n=1 Tax=Nocardioides jejuensis TaxID=2502782 RepID=A0A4R1BVC4_9ACTN|nr:hypothetical protein [Nocardioides jejuensis]TCJ21721.1 hypothetical protein EPD65_14335 [Nocardioides jejuensis]
MTGATGVTGAAFVPMTPLFFRHLSGQADPVAELRDAAVDAVREACRGAEQVVALCPVGGREAPGDWHDPSRTRPLHGAPRSLAEQVGEHLLELAGVDLPATYVECTDGEADFRGLLDPGVRTALVVLGDGAAARSQGAPGHIDERSFAYDDAVAAALAAADRNALASLAQAPEAFELMVTGRHTWPVAARLEPRLHGGSLTHRSDPFGLTYVVARW